MGTRRLLKRDVVLVVVETADGLRGAATAGASSSAMRKYFQGDSEGTFADILNGPVADIVEGETVEVPADVHHLLAGTDLSEQVSTEAISALDVAVYNLLGKEAGTPVFELLADEYSTDPETTLPLYASAGMYMEPDGYVEQASVIEDLGFFGYKYRPGIGPEGDHEAIDCLAETLEDCEFILDAHTWWKLGEAYGEDTVRDIVSHADDQGLTGSRSLSDLTATRSTATWRRPAPRWPAVRADPRPPNSSIWDALTPSRSSKGTCATTRASRAARRPLSSVVVAM